ncbi:Periplasmic binding protein precursor [Bosea sp. LC85]|uniref:ABC transporter substrate-binding protein n=1 Tax=Bosea sp. LC85 TaxID=1502851 RepID=UPI0004E35861|nr:ABC transporter substrate-binding protein [Bosea sp. LC85]KFC69351.1 Periplasmic binding protein precursor [Bosea sp. LC85]
MSARGGSHRRPSIDACGRALAALLCRLVLALLVITGGAPAWAESVAVTDVLGRVVTVTVPVQRVILGEGRQIHAIAALDRDAPFRRIVGWRDDLQKADPDSYRGYVGRYPAIAALPALGAMSEGNLDIETVIALKPDVLFLNVEAEIASAETKLVEKLASVGIPVVYVDFRHAPFVNTEPSLRLMGRLFGRSEVAEELIAFRAREIARVTDRLAGLADLKRPLVMVDRIPGYSDDCCMTFGPENFGRMVEIAGGRNLGSLVLPGTFGTANPETIIAMNPDVVIATGGNWGALAPGGAWVGLGPGADLTEAKRKLANLAKRPAFAHTAAVTSGRVHAIWHQFYNNPYQFVAIQRIARWLHPELFADLDPEATLRELHERFLPLPYQPGYWVELGGEGGAGPAAR